MSAVLYWSVHEHYAEDETPNAPLIWRHDPAVADVIDIELQPIADYIEKLTFAIMEAGYDYAKERAACFTLLSLVPEYRGELPQAKYNAFRYLIKIAGSYLQTTTDTVAMEEGAAAPLREVIFGNFWRALLADSENQMALHHWGLKASFYLELTGAHTRTRGHIWLDDWFPDIGWIGLMTGSQLPAAIGESSIIGVTRPDIVAMLCIYGCTNYAEILVVEGYDLTEYILYAFQPNFWSENNSFAVDLEPLTKLCLKAIEIREDQIANPVFDPTADNFGLVITDIDEIDTWQEGNRDVATLQSLLRIGAEKTSNPEDMAAISAAMKYLVTFPSPLNLGN